MSRFCPQTGRTGLLLCQLRRQANANTTDTAVAVRIFMQILLVIVFCVVERQSGGDLGRHLTVVVGVAHRLLEARQAVAGRCVLFRSERIDRRAVLGAVVITLTHALRRVVVSQNT